LIGASADVNARFNASVFTVSELLMNKPTLLQYAAFYGSIKCFTLLLERNASVSNTDENGRQLIEFCAASDLDLFMEHGVHRPLKCGNEVLILAEYFHLETLVKWLDSFNNEDYDRNALLLSAVNGNNLQTLMFCLGNGYDINATDVYGQSPLLWALHNDVVDVVIALIENSGIRISLSEVFLCVIRIFW
jgi:ankyrin repeat protein